MRIVQRIPVLLIIVYVYIDSGYAQINKCGSGNFRCKNGQCITGDLLCDGRADCRDSSDETEVECNKPEILCSNLAFRCNYGACITGSYVCNGIRDCVDNSDENRCNTTNSQTETPCVTGQFTCNNGQCIDDTAVCDGIEDCTDGSDEISRCKSLPCAHTNFRCKYGACIDGNLQCNGVKNCADNSDEDPNLCRPGWDTIFGSTPTPQPTSGPTPTSGTRPTVTRPTATRPTLPSPSRNGCRAPPQPQNGHWKLHRSQCPDRQDCTVPEGTDLGLGSHLVYSCDSGYKIKGSTDVSCSIEGKWLNIPVCQEIRCKGLAKPSVRAECIYDDEWISCKSSVPPKTKATLTCENSYRPETTLLSGQRKHVRCNANGQWEPEPMRCIPVCGALPSDVTPTVVGGFRPNITEFPWHATLYLDEDGSKEFFCGASIIQESLLMTAAHCVYDENLRQLIDANKIHVLTGNLFRDYNYRHPSNPNLVKENQVKRIYIVRNYLGLVGNYLEDIAILELVQPFVLSAYLVPVCIDTLSDRSVLEAGTYGKVAGFGRTQFGASSGILQALIVPIIPLSQCRSVSQTINTEQYITNDKFCAGYTNGSSVCDGDSGGGLVLKTNNLWYLRGIVSVSLGALQEGGITRCNHNLYSLYTEVSRHISWIQDVITKIEQNQTHQLCSEQSPTRCSNLI